MFANWNANKIVMQVVNVPSVVLLLFFVLLVSNSVYAAIPPSAYIQVLYNGNEISDAEFYGEFLVCEKKEYSSHNVTVPQLDINLYDSEKNCYWKPPAWEYRWDNCGKSKCDFFMIPYGKTKFSLYIPSLDKVFITNEVKADTGSNYFQMDLSSDGSALISTTDPFDMDIYDNDTNPDKINDNTSVGDTTPSFLEGKFSYLICSTLFFVILVLIVWMISRKKSKKWG
jgi:hypothetical protein